MYKQGIPPIMYGTAWKEDATELLVFKAITLGFKGIDTANQRCHYNEAAVGNAITKALKTGMKREDLFIQTKFTYASSQDHRIPYDPHANFAAQVKQSFQSSLEHLQTEYIDSYLLHGPSTRVGLAEDDLQVWQEMESLHKQGLARHLGISNINIEQLHQLYAWAQIKPSFVQNRCFAAQGWDREVREFCKRNDITYQAFSLLTANPFVHSKIRSIAKRVNKTPAQVIFKFAMLAGMLPLTGTTKEKHMKEDLELDFNLIPKEIRFIEDIALN